MDRGAEALSLRARLAALERAYGDAVPIDDLVEVMRGLLESLQGDVALQERRVYGELEALAGLIRRTREEIREIRPEEIRAEHIPGANVELDAIVRHLEEATGNILDAAETIETVAAVAAPELGAPLLDAVTSIYEACNFQDISGQRITKVVATLQTIETRLVLLVEALGCIGRNPRESSPNRASPCETHLLAGPQLPDNANSQAEIDALLASLD